MEVIADNKIFNKRPLIISGPCSAETEKQLISTAVQLASDARINLLRAGIWKPRTKPGMFEGVGTVGLKWLQEAKQKSGIPTTVEVATARHVEEALSHEVDVLWVGARTTVNPFSVQEIADALKGVDIPVLIKNPINPDLELWCGAVERMQKSGLNNIALIHRGFSSFGNTKYRNAPMWQLPIEMKRRFPDLVMICDPSHICGNRTLLQDVAQKSINLDFNGLMIETHIDPDNAWSDASQQITPRQLQKMLDTLKWRSVKGEDDLLNSPLNKLREQIDQTDDELISLLSQRMKLADEIGQYKKEHNIIILQTERWNNILERLSTKAEQMGLSKTFIRKYFEAIHLESINHQNDVMNK